MLKLVHGNMKERVRRLLCPPAVGAVRLAFERFAQTNPGVSVDPTQKAQAQPIPEHHFLKGVIKSWSFVGFLKDMGNPKKGRCLIS